MMFDIENAEAGYVVAAYGIAAMALLGLLFASWRTSRRTKAEWHRLQAGRGADKA